MSKRTSDAGVVKVIKRERDQAFALPWKVNADNTDTVSRGPTLKTAGCATREKMVYWYCSLNTGLFISPSGISELDCATTKTDTAERYISIGRESLQVFFVLGALAYFQVPPLGGSRDEK